MPRDYRLYVDDILEAVKRIQNYTRDMNYKSFSSDLKTQDAVIRNLDIIGEAARHLRPEKTRKAPGIEWPKISGLRSILTHEYFGVNLPIIWDVVEHKLDSLFQACRDLLE
jgi:uncharacterized protein with HEPN domain